MLASSSSAESTGPRAPRGARVGSPGTPRDRGRDRRGRIWARAALRGPIVRPSNLRLLGRRRSWLEGCPAGLAPDGLDFGRGLVGRGIVGRFGGQPVRPAAEAFGQSIRARLERTGTKPLPLRAGRGGG